MSIYHVVILLHSATRWAVLALGAYALLRTATGILAKGGWLPADDKARKFFPIALDIQVVVGVLLMFVSPVAQHAFSDLGTAMGDRALRIAVVEHPFIAIAALAIAHVGSSKVRKVKEPRAKFKTMLLFYAMALLLLVARMPAWKWPTLS